MTRQLSTDPTPTTDSAWHIQPIRTLHDPQSRLHVTRSSVYSSSQALNYVIMGGGKVTQVTSKAQWDQIMSQNAGKAVRAMGGRGDDLPQNVGQSAQLLTLSPEMLA